MNRRCRIYRPAVREVTISAMSSPQTFEVLNSRFAVPGVVRFEQTPSGLVRIVVAAASGEAAIYLHGAHVSHYRPRGQAPLLFMSARSMMEPGRPIRGGVPVCFPWFGPRAGDPAAPLHGFARIRTWMLESVTSAPDGAVHVVMSLRDSPETRQIWPHAFALTFRVHVGSALAMTLEVSNPSGQPFVFEEALHTYFAVGDARKVTIAGLEGATYIDKTDGMKRKQQDGPVTIAAETDRVYVNTPATCVIDDPVLARRIIVEKAGSNTTTVWNPWVAKARAMPDFGDDEWTGMVCVETANAAENALTLAPGASHAMTQRIRVE